LTEPQVGNGSGRLEISLGTAPRPTRAAPGGRVLGREAQVPRLLSVALSVGGSLLVLLTLRPSWRNPLQGDDMWLILALRKPNETTWQNAIAEASRPMGPGRGHFNPFGYFLDALVKGSMLDAGPSAVSGMAIHYAAIAVAALISLWACADILTSCFKVVASLRVPRSVGAACLAVAFTLCVQMSPAVSPWDPWVSQPVYGAAITAIGLTFLASSIRACASPGRGGMVPASLLGVAGLLTYELMAVPLLVSMVLWAWVWTESTDRRGVVVKASWIHGPAILTLVGSRMLYEVEKSGEYGGTTLRPSVQSLGAWAASVRSSAPGSSWAAPASDWWTYADDAGIAIEGKLPWLVAGLAIVLMFAASRFFGAAPRLRIVEDKVRGDACLALAPGLLLVGAAPIPYVMTEFWSKYFLRANFNYMQTQLQAWGWAFTLSAIFVVIVTRPSLASKPRSAFPQRLAVISGILIVVGGGAAVQTSVNLRNVEIMDRAPLFGVDIVQALETPPAAEESTRCEAIQNARLVAFSLDWFPHLNAEYERDFGVPFCES
jgi:hypothetical protein